jgi:hypothetical protein
VSDTVDALQDVERAVQRVEKAAKDKWSTVQWVGLMFIGSLLWSLPEDIWHAKWRYGLSYNVSSDKVIVDEHPHDCAFLAAPVGEKYCRYEREVSTLRWSTSLTGNPLVSYDDGKTWNVFTPDSTDTVPKFPTVEQVRISWTKVSE